jgi:SPP1 gp7 family putative phage head morphogenesis protein
MPLPERQIEALIKDVYAGVIDLDNLPPQLYAYTVFELDSSFFMGYGGLPRGDIKVIEKAVNYRQNISHFSGAKTFQEVSSLTKAVFDDEGRKRAFAQYKEIALEIDSTYNVKWLKTEQDTVFLQSQNARKWMNYEGEADIFPVLEYVTIGDDRVRPSHADLDGLKASVDDPIWNRIFPQNGWGCRCTVIQHTPTRKTSATQKEEKTRKIRDEFKKTSGKFNFDYNPGKTDFIFKEKGKGKHDYFKVPKKHSDDLKNNFGFPAITEVTGRFI